ncbi:MAG: carboxypeptidase-like regulatory domain-containing protein [Fulvivirga sp.]|uniref:carboxypeptidase-like regulatory domain-containing protein n=1 Tax=Fulvivirga sp. TaxID=1931237 RepID=UPI0032ECCEEE
MVISLGAYSQKTITISGRLIDADTEEPIIFASIGIDGKSVGTVSNTEGKFDFHIPYIYKDHMMVIRMLGYSNIQTKISNYANSDTVTFRMNKASKVLEEIVIRDSLTGGDIVSAAISKIDKNFPDEPFLMDGFYRDLKKVGGKYFSLLEAAVKIYDEDYKAPNNKNRLHERVALMEVRKSLGYSNKFTRYFEQYNLLEDLLLHNNIRYRQFPEQEVFYNSFKRGKTTMYNGKQVHVAIGNFLVPDNAGTMFIKLFVEVESYSIVRMEYERRFNNEVLRKKGDLVSKYVSDVKTIDFKEYLGKMYLNLITLRSRINWHDEETDQLKFETELQQELLINNIETNPDERIGRTERMRRYGLQYQDESYNKEFWENYNVIKDTPLDEEIVSDLEELGTLEEQFEY